MTLIDRNNYHQFQPLLYQVATSLIAGSDIAHSLREVFADQENVDVKLAEVTALDPANRTVTTADGASWTGDALVLAAGSQPNFFHTPGAAEHTFPLYSLDDATRLRSRILGLFEQVDREPALIERGALNFVVVGGGPTGVEVAGALADMIELTVPAEYRNFDAGAARIHLLDYGDTLLRAFSEEAHGYVAKVLQERKVESESRYRRQRGRARPRASLGRHHHPHALRRLGRWHHRRPGRRRLRFARLAGEGASTSRPT